MIHRVSSLLVAVTLLGCLQIVRGEQLPSDRKQFLEVKERAEKGDAEAQLSLGGLYYAGIGVKRDPKAGAKWHRKAAEQGLARAQMELAADYARGDGVKPDAFEAFKWMSLAANQGLAEAQYRCGLCLAKGDGVPRSATEAVKLFRQAADQGFPAAEYELAKSYLEGSGVAKNIEEGVMWLSRSASRGFSSAQHRLGLCFYRGEGVARDNLEAHKWLNLAAGQDGPEMYDAKISLSKVETLMTAEEVALARRLAREFKASEDSSLEAPADAQKPDPLAAGGPGFGWVTVSGPEENCDVYVNGDFVGNTPAKLKLREGVYRIEVRRAGFKPFHRELKVSEGAELTLRAILEKS